jgi:peptidoglycan hydrolase CwlO-like protein
MANKKKERDAEFKAMQDEVKKLPGEIAEKEAEIKRMTGGIL